MIASASRRGSLRGRISNRQCDTAHGSRPSSAVAVKRPMRRRPRRDSSEGLCELMHDPIADGPGSELPSDVGRALALAKGTNDNRFEPRPLCIPSQVRQQQAHR